MAKRKSAQEHIDSFFGKVGKPPKDLTRCQECDGKGYVHTMIGPVHRLKCDTCKGTGVGQEEDE